jgi:hypothetical protein
MPTRCERIKFFADARAVRIFHLPVFTQGFFGERGDVLFRFRHRGAQRFIRFERSSEQFRLRHGKLFGGKFCAVEFFREFQNRIVTVQINVVQNRASCALLDLGVEQTGAAETSRSLAAKSLSVWRTIFMWQTYSKKPGV